MNYLNRILIKWRIFGGFGVLVVLSAGMAVYSIWAFSDVGAKVTGLTTLSEITVRALTTSRTLEAMRRGATRYSISGDASLVKEFTDNQAKADALLKASAQATHSEDRQRLYNGLSDELTAHRAFFDKLVNLINDTESNRAKLFTSGDELTAATAKLVDGARASGNASTAARASEVNAAIRAVGDAGLRFLATNDPKGPAAFQTNAEKAAAAIGALQSAAGNELRGLIEPVSAALQAYKASFEDVSAAMQTRDEVFQKGIDPQQADMQAKLTTAVDSLVNDFGVAKDATQSVVVTTSRTQAVIAALSFVIGAAFAYLIGGGIVRPLTKMTAAMKKLAAGDKSVAIPSADARDEIGEMAKAVQVFKDNMIEADRLRGEQEQVKARAEADKKASMHKMADEFDAGVKGIVRMVTSASNELQTTAQSMSATAEETSRRSTAVAAASEQASSNVQTVATAAEELSSSIAEISRQVSESTRIAGEASEQATATNTQIQGLAESAQRIGDVVKLITDIAGQTNLLALNATIEAARAGEAGKGFAVVASEVKSLANQTAKATEEISAKIAEMQAATGQSVQAVQTIGQTIGRINEIATAIASAVEEQGAATKEIARNVQQASLGTGEVSANIAGVTKAASDTGSAAVQVLDAAGELSKQSETLQTQVDGFIAKIRAA